MGKTAKIFKREFSSRVRNKSFIIMTLLGPLLLASILIVPMLIEKYEQKREKRVAIIDESNLLGQTLRDFDTYKLTVVVNATVDEMSETFATSGFDAVLFIPNNIYSSNSVILYSNVWVDEALKAYVGYALRRDLEYMALMHENVSPETIGKVSTPVFVVIARKFNLIAIICIRLFYFRQIPVQYILRLINQRNVVAQFFDRFHVMRGKNDGRSIFFQAKNFLFNDLCIQWVKTTKRFVEYEQRRFMKHCRDKLHLLLHTF